MRLEGRRLEHQRVLARQVDDAARKVGGDDEEDYAVEYINDTAEPEEKAHRRLQ